MQLLNDLSILFGSLTVAITCILILTTKKYHINYTSNSLPGPQKIHNDRTPRIGGFCLLLGMLAQFFYVKNTDTSLFLLFIICSLPAFLSGFIEDLTNKIKPQLRLCACFITSFLIIFLTDTHIRSIGFILIDHYLSIDYIAFTITVLSIVALTQAVNIIDGLNGLSLGTSLLILFAIYSIANLTNDQLIVNQSLLLIFLVLVLLLFNFPNAKIFLGDGGAYLIGSFLSCYVILLSQRSDVISPFASLLIIIFPIYELFRSMLRRIFDKNKNPFQPDSKHFHSLIFKLIKRYSSMKPKFINPVSSILVLCLPLTSCLLAIKFYDDQLKLIYTILFYIIIIEIMFLLINFFLSRNLESKT